MRKVTASIWQDTRRIKKNGTYPVKLKVYEPMTRKVKSYPTKYDLTEKDFFQVWESKKVKSDFKDLKFRLSALENRAFEVIDSIEPFSFDLFEKKLFGAQDKAGSVIYHYDQCIQKKLKNDKISTSDVYKNSKKLLVEYWLERRGNKSTDTLTFARIDVDFLEGIERYALNERKQLTRDSTKRDCMTVNTLSIYLRCLKTIFNSVIESGEVSAQSPFGKGKYQIPSKSNTKKALSIEELRALRESVPSNEMQQKAKDFWFFSFACNGMNMNDIARLRFSDFYEDKFEFYRGKTLDTSKANLKPVRVFLNDYAKEIIQKYSVEDNKPNGYVFGMIDEKDDAENIKRKVKNFTRYLNQHLKLLAKDNDVNERVSSNWARHTFATTSINKGATMEFMQESLGHKNVKTTQNYFAGFDDESKKEFAQNIMDF